VTVETNEIEGWAGVGVYHLSHWSRQLNEKVLGLPERVWNSCHAASYRMAWCSSVWVIRFLALSRVG